MTDRTSTQTHAVGLVVVLVLVALMSLMALTTDK